MTNHHPTKKINYRGFNYCQLSVPAKHHGQPNQTVCVLLVESNHPIPVFDTVADCQQYIDDIIDEGWMGV